MVTTRNGTISDKGRSLHRKQKTTKKTSLSEKFGIGLGKYVSDVEFSQIPIILNADIGNIGTDGKNDLSGTNLDSPHSSTEEDVAASCTNVNDKASLTKDKSISNSSDAGAKKKNAWNDFRVMHKKYKEDWREYPPSEETRPMRLTEFIWAHSDPPSGPYKYDMDDAVDRTLFALNQPSQSCKEFLNEHYKKEALEKKNALPSDTSSTVSNVSQESCQYSIQNNSSDFETENNHPIETVVLDDSSDSDDELQTHTPNVIHRNVNIVLTSQTHKLHIPDFYHVMYHSNESDETKEKLFKAQEWVTDSLEEEMSHYYPLKVDMRRDSLTNDVSMNKESFALNFNKMFPQDRVFLNNIQLRDAVKLFFNHWNLVCKGNSKTLRCSYSHIPAKKKQCEIILPDGSSGQKKKIRKSIASQVKCPFEIKWSLLDYKRPYRHDIFYKVKISNIISTHHTCLMSNMSYVVAVKSTKGHTKLDLASVKTAVDVLKANPTLPTAMLRPLVKNALPQSTNLDSKFLNNFKRRVALYHVKNKGACPLTIEEGKSLTRNQNFSSSEFIGMNDPITQTNLNGMFSTIMREDTNTWSAISFLKNCKETIHGFDYRVLYSTGGIPTAILYMTSRMRYNLLRYGNIMFLDGQKRRFNKLNWPYIGPVIKNGDNRIGVTCESIVTTEDIATYTWIFKAMLSIEPRWSFSNIQIIYADGLVTKRLLINLGIQHSCVLHGDYYHLMRENWPKPQNFGIVVFRLIKSFLASMLTSTTEEEWDNAYHSAFAKITAHPSKVSLLNKIYNNPQYYAGYVTSEIVGNLKLNGSVPAEQNHSSNVRFIGDVMLNSVCEEIKSLLERQQQLCNKENDIEQDYTVRSHRYLPQLHGELAVEDISARNVLAGKPHKDYFILQSKATEYLQSIFDSDAMVHKVWPANESFDSDNQNHLSFAVGGRCPCWRRIDFNIQCKHELKINPKFKKHHWGHRWYNRKEYNRQFPSHTNFNLHSETITIDENDHGDVGLTNDENITISEHASRTSGSKVINVDYEDHESTVRNSIIDNYESTVKYKDLVEVATDLCRTVSDHPMLCKSTYNSLHEWTAKLRSGDDFDVAFHNKNINLVRGGGGTKMPHPAVVSPPLQGRKRHKRLKSSQEYQRGLFTSHPEKQNKSVATKRKRKSVMADDELFVSGGKQRKLYCFLCRQPGCTRWKCNILQEYCLSPGRILQKGHQESRDRLCDIISSLKNKVVCYKRKRNDKRNVYDEFPKKIKALVIHNKYVIHNNVAHFSRDENICLECTLLGDNGKVIVNYDRALFHRPCVIRYVVKGINNLIVDNLS